MLTDAPGVCLVKKTLLVLDELGWCRTGGSLHSPQPFGRNQRPYSTPLFSRINARCGASPWPLCSLDARRLPRTVQRRVHVTAPNSSGSKEHVSHRGFMSSQRVTVPVTSPNVISKSAYQPGVGAARESADFTPVRAYGIRLESAWNPPGTESRANYRFGSDGSPGSRGGRELTGRPPPAAACGSDHLSSSESSSGWRRHSPAWYCLSKSYHQPGG